MLGNHLQAEIAFDLQRTLSTLTEDCLFEDVARGIVYRGKSSVGDYYKEWWTTFEIEPVDIRSHVVSEEFLVVETRFRGFHRKSWEGIAATGKAIDLPVTIFITLRDGLMAGERFYYDRATLLDQIARS